MMIYAPFEQEIGGGRLFVRTRTDPYALVPAITRTVREMAADQPVERALTLVWLVSLSPEFIVQK